MSDVFILSAKRTPLGSFLGSLAPLPAPRLGATAIAAALDASGVDPGTVEQTVMGNVLQAGQGQAPARQASLYAGLPQSTGAITVHKVCGSGMRAIMDGANGIRVGEWSTVVAGGMESMSNAPHLLERSRGGYRLGDVSITDSMIKDGLWDPYDNQHMGNCAELCARKYDFSREAQDAYARESYARAQRAIREGLFEDEIEAVSVPQRKGAPVLVEQDEEPFRTSLKKMATLKPAFEKGGSVTAGNASTLSDGAAALILSGSSDHGPPLARIVAAASFAQEPKWFTTSPVAAARAALDRSGLQAKDIDLWEVNEAFAVVAMAFVREFDLNPEIVNQRGGAVALGHPIGCSGARIVITLLHNLLQEKKRYGCASLCIGGGEATAMVIENLRF